MRRRVSACGIIFFNDTATTEIYTLSLHDALPICRDERERCPRAGRGAALLPRLLRLDRKITRLNQSPYVISYAVFCLKKKNRIYPKFTYHVDNRSSSLLSDLTICR